MQYYFPKDGKFEHQPSNVSENLVVTAKSTLNEIEVGKKRVIKKVETFEDLMLTTKGDEAKKETILDLLANKKE